MKMALGVLAFLAFYWLTGFIGENLPEWADLLIIGTILFFGFRYVFGCGHRGR